jgi:hypothetical protein
LDLPGTNADGKPDEKSIARLFRELRNIQSAARSMEAVLLAV